MSDQKSATGAVNQLNEHASSGSGVGSHRAGGSVAGQDATDGNKTAVVFVNRSGDRGEDDAEEDEPSHIPIAQALDSFLRVMETTATEGRQRKLDATLSQEDDSVPTENEYPDGADVVQGKEELDQPTNPDVVYVLCGYMMSSEDAASPILMECFVIPPPFIALSFSHMTASPKRAESPTSISS